MSRTPPSPGEHSARAGSPRDEIGQLQEAIRSQRDIGMAIGLVSARFGCSTESAWRLMLRVSQDGNVKVRTVARTLVVTHDGTAGPDDLTVLGSLLTHLPPSGWPLGPWEDPRS